MFAFSSTFVVPCLGPPHNFSMKGITNTHVLTFDDEFLHLPCNLVKTYLCSQKGIVSTNKHYNEVTSLYLCPINEKGASHKRFTTCRILLNLPLLFQAENEKVPNING